MKLYKFAAHNWKSGHPFWVYKRFPSAYAADRWACRISFDLRNSPYLIALYGEEND